MKVYRCVQIVLIVTQRLQIDYMCSATSYVLFRPRGNLTVKRGDEYKTLSVGPLDTKVYCYCLL